MRLPAMASVLFFATSPCAAQSIGGVEIGTSDSNAMSLIAGKSYPIPQDKSRKIILSEKGDIIVGVCSGIVYSVQEDIGSTVYDFSVEVKSNTSYLGNPTYMTRDVRGRTGKAASITASWIKGEIFTETDIFENESGKITVFRRIRKDSECER
jgi:hypothetical protein